MLTVLRFLTPDGAERAFSCTTIRASSVSIPAGSRPRGVRRARFVHILDGIDHLLFLFCLVIPFRRRARCRIVTSFTVAHSITLIASAYGSRPTPSGSRRSSKR